MLNSNQRRPSVIRLVAYRRCGGGGFEPEANALLIFWGEGGILTGRHYALDSVYIGMNRTRTSLQFFLSENVQRCSTCFVFLWRSNSYG